MNAPVKIDHVPEAETSVSFVADPKVAIAVLTDVKQRDDFFATIKADLATFVPDISTAKGREELKALAFKVTRTKTFIDPTRKVMTEEARKKVDATNAAGRVIWDQLEALATQTRKPVTEWEETEKARVAEVASTFGAIEELARTRVEDSSEAVTSRVGELGAMIFNPETFGDSLERAQGARADAIAALQVQHARLTQEEADRAELASLRKATADREAADAAAAEERAAEGRRQQEARDAQAVADQAAATATEAARMAAEVATATALREADEAHQAELRRADDARIAAEAETLRLAGVQAARDQQAKADADAATARAADIAHRSEIMGAAKLAFMDLGIPEAKAKAAVLAITAGSVPHVSISF